MGFCRGFKNWSRFINIYMSFKEWSEKRLKLEFQSIATPNPVKKWSLSKEEIIKLWRNLNPSAPLVLSPIDSEHEGSTYSEDGVRITGSPAFIYSVISKLKGFLEFESPNTKLSVSYRETQSPSQLEKGRLKRSYVFYVQVKQRSGTEKQY